jgi:hypothetical protein
MNCSHLLYSRTVIALRRLAKDIGMGCKDADLCRAAEIACRENDSPLAALMAAIAELSAIRSRIA